MEVKNGNAFLERLKTGINLFTGAGFSLLPSDSGITLPSGKEFCREIITHFNLKDISESYELDYVSEFCPEIEYQNYLRNRFKVSDYNKLYDVLNLININTYVTTNIDNIVRLVMDNSQRYYLRNIREYGAPTISKNEITYIPLHGDVLDLNSLLYFKKFDLAIVDDNNRDLFNQMFGLLAKRPLLFIGYGFNDKGVLGVVNRLISMGASDIWVQLLPEDKANIKLFESKGCHVIEANTEELLIWIRDHINYDKGESDIRVDGNALSTYRIPTISQISAVPTQEFFQQGHTHWYPILSNIAFERPIISIAEDLALKYKNVIITGSRFSGKTTTLMQLASKINTINKFFLDGVTKEEAKFVLKQIGNCKAWVFFKNCCSDINAFIFLAKQDNIYLIGTSDDYQLETVKHIIFGEVTCKILECTELSNSEALGLYNKIPSGIKRPTFSFKEDDVEKYSMLEFVAKNIVGVYTRKTVSRMLSEIFEADKNVFSVIALAAYLTEKNSALSYSLVSRLLKIDIYPGGLNMINKTKNYLREFNLTIETEGDFFVIRSSLFSMNILKILIEDYRDYFAQIVRFVVEDASSYNIFRYDIFRRKAFDSQLFRRIFSIDEAVRLYNILYSKDQNPYTLQQKALCQSLFGDYKNAFQSIDKALSIMPNNFSFRNSQAIIMFEANKSTISAESVSYMKKAMEILKQCYIDDKRKTYHAQKFAEFAIILHSDYDCDEYLENAQQWLDEIVSEDGFVSIKTQKLREQIASALSAVIV